MIFIALIGFVCLFLFVIQPVVSKIIRNSWEPVAGDQEHTICRKCGGPCPVQRWPETDELRRWCGKC